MKNNMLKNIKITLLLFVLLLSFQVKSISEEFNFEGNEIQILNNGNRLISDNGIKITSDDNVEITADEFDYDKLKSVLLLNGNIIINDIVNKTIIKTNKIKYLKKIEKIITYGETKINVNDNYFISSSDIIFYRNEEKITSDKLTSVNDKYKNSFTAKEFLFLLNSENIKAKNVTLKDSDGNKSYLESFFGNLKNKEFYGKDFKLNFNNETFGNKQNQPRLYGNSIKSNENTSVITKGVFTTCKKRDKCPPWEMKAEKVIHDKQKKIINYKNAWLKIYDKPIIYFPKFFHPDPTVKRQSGFLIPQFSDSGNTGTSFQIPYFKVIADNKDLTFKPTVFTNQNLILQNEYRQVNKNYEHIMDFSLFSSVLNDGVEPSKSHLFSNTKIDLNDSFFNESNLEINLQQVTNDTYLKKFKIDSPLINNENLMYSYFKYSGYNQDSSLSLSFETYEDLSKKPQDRYEYIYPNLKYLKELNTTFNLAGSLNLTTELYQKQYETNKYKQSFISDLTYNSISKIISNGIIKDYKLSLKNPNIREKKGSDNESDTNNKLLSQLMYSLSYPLKKEGEIYDSFIKPSISYRYSPNNTRNISSEDRRLDISNINSFNRIAIGDGVEGGQSLTANFDYQKKDKNGNDKISLNLAQVYRDKANPDLPTNSTLNKKYSDIIGKLKFDLLDNLNFEYNFMLDNNLDKSNYNSINTNLTVNNFVTNFEYLEEDGEIGSKSFIKNETSYSFDENNSIQFATRKNRELNLTEFYNLIYQYENDCLKAAIEYNKTFYNDSDLKPEEEILFSLTIVPFTKLSSKNLKK